MVFELSSEQRSHLQSLYDIAQNDPSSQTAFADCYDYVVSLITYAGGPVDTVDAGTWEWFQGAAQVNRGVGAFSQLIRAYSRSEYAIRFGGTPLTDEALQIASNSIAAAVIHDVLTNGEIPDLDALGRDDAQGTAARLFYGDNAGWSGNILFPALGDNTFLQDNIINSPGDTYNVLASLKSLYSAGIQVDWTNLPSALLQGVNLIGGSTSPDGGAAASAAAGQILDFFRDSYGSSFNLYDADSIVLDQKGLSHSLTGTDDADIINAFDGDDTIMSSANSDLIDGGSGIDTVDYSTAGSIALTIEADDTTDAVYVGSADKQGILNSDILYNIERIIESDDNDTLDLDSVDPRQTSLTIDAGSGYDTADVSLAPAAGSSVRSIGGDGTLNFGGAITVSLIDFEKISLIGDTPDVLVLADLDRSAKYALIDLGSSGNDLDARGRHLVDTVNASALSSGVNASLRDPDNQYVEQNGVIIRAANAEGFVGTAFSDNIVTGPTSDTGGIEYVDAGGGDDRITAFGNAEINGGAGNDVIHLRSPEATIDFGTGGGSDVVEFENGDGDYNLSLQNLNPSDIELIAGGRDVYDGWQTGQEPDGFWYQFITVRIKATGDQVTFLENGTAVGPDGSGSASGYNEAINSDYRATLNLPLQNQGKLDTISFADGTVWDQTTLWKYLSVDSAGSAAGVDVKWDYWGFGDGQYFALKGYPRMVDDTTIYHSAASYLDYVNSTYLQAAPIAAPVIVPLQSQTVTGTAGDDYLSPGVGNDTVSGGAGNDYITESGGDDTYVWNVGDGNDTIDGAAPTDGFNTLQLGTGVSRSDLQYAVASGGAGLKLSFAGQDGSVTLTDELLGAGLGVDRIKFADGTTLSRSDMLADAASVIAAARQTVVGTGNDDTLYAPSGNFVLTGGAGDDNIHLNGAGSGVFQFAAADGHDQIIDSGTGYSREDVLDLTDVTPDGVQLARSGDALLVTIAATGASVNVQAQFAGEDADEEHGLSAIKFADGTIWTRIQILAKVLGIPDGALPEAGAGSASAVEDAAIVRGTLYATSPAVDDALTFSLDAPVAGLVLAADGSWSFDPSASAYQHLAAGAQATVSAGYHVVDQVGGISSSTLTLTVTGTADMPTVNEALTNQRLADNMPFTYAVAGNFSNVDDGNLALSAKLADGSALPEWLSFQNGQFTGTAPSGTSAVLDIVVEASGGTLSTSSDFLLHVGPDDRAPVVHAPLSDATASALTPVDVAIPANAFSDPDGDALTLSATLSDGSALPDWLTFNSGHLVGTPPSDAVGSYDLTITASDGQAAVSSNFALTISQPAISGTPDDDTFNLTSGFIIDGGQGNDTYLVSGAGGGTIEFAKGDGQDLLLQTDAASRSDILQFTGVNSDEVSILTQGDAAFFLVDSTGDGVISANQFSDKDPGGVPQGIGLVEFADGVSWDRNEIENRTNGNDVTVGGSGSETTGSGLSETFVVPSGLGDAVVNGFMASGAGHDYIQFDRSQFSDWAHVLGATVQQGSDLIIALDGSDSVRLTNVALSNFTSLDVKFGSPVPG